MSFTPKGLLTPPARPMYHNAKGEPYPTFVVQFAYRHQSPLDLREEAKVKIFSKKTSVQLFLGIKVYDDQVFEYVLIRRDNRYWQRAVSIDMKVNTEKTLILPTECLLWGVDLAKPVEDFVLEWETLRYVLSTPGTLRSLHS
jgi:hypothetical protein